MKRLALSSDGYVIMSVFNPDPPRENLFRRGTMLAAIFPSGGPTKKFAARILLEGTATNAEPMRGRSIRLVMQKLLRWKIYSIYYRDGDAWIPWTADRCPIISGKPVGDGDIWQRTRNEFLGRAATWKVGPHRKPPSAMDSHGQLTRLSGGSRKPTSHEQSR